MQGLHATLRHLPLLAPELAVALVASAFDLLAKRVPNALTLTVLAFAPVGWALWMRGSPGAFSLSGPVLFGSLSILGAFVCAVVPLALFRFSMIGGGDVKLLACIGALALPGTGLFIEWLSFSMAALIIPAVLTYRGRLWATATDATWWIMGPITLRRLRPAPAELRERIRFSPYVLAATLASAFLQGAP